MTSREELLRIWTEEPRHELYVEGEDRSQLLVRTVEEVWPDRSIKILEPGCNIGRNLFYLREAGYENLSGIDISPRAVPFMRDTFPGLIDEITFYEGRIEEFVSGFADEQFDVIVTMAVLMHIHPESEWIFAHLARVARMGIVTIENEKLPGQYRWPRNYEDVFTEYGFTQDLSMSCEGYSALSSDWMLRRFIRREE